MKRTLYGTLLLLLFGSAIALLTPTKAFAAYEPGRVIDNSVFLNTNTMSFGQIQDFLVSKGSGLANRSFLLNCYAADSKERQWYNTAGAPCDQVVPASQIIYFAAKAYGLNPQVVLATLQKEQSLITTANPTDWQINQAMGYGCPTTGGCGASNFFYQIDNGTWVLRFHYERASRNMTWWTTSTTWTCGTEKNFYKPNLYPGQNVNFYDQDSILYRTVYIENAATSSMYCYTPHTYNNPLGLYGRDPYGTTGRYYSGSYNFVNYFELWFGSTKQNIEATNDRFNLRTEPRTDGTGVIRTVPRSELSTAICYQRGGDYIIEGTPGNTWLNVNTPAYGWVATDAALFASFLQKGTPQCPTAVKPLYRAYNTQRQRHFWTADENERNFVLSTLRFTEGAPTFFVVDEARAQGKPVYRLYNRARETHFWTTDLGERAFVRDRLGFIDEGYAYSVAYGGEGTKPVWRLYDRRNERHFWTADENEKNFVIAQLGFQFEGEAFRVPQ